MSNRVNFLSQSAKNFAEKWFYQRYGVKNHKIKIKGRFQRKMWRYCHELPYILIETVWRASISDFVGFSPQIRHFKSTEVLKKKICEAHEEIDLEYIDEICPSMHRRCNMLSNATVSQLNTKIKICWSIAEVVLD